MKILGIYDNGGKTCDRYTVCYSKTDGEYPYVGMSENPTHPQGFGQHGSHKYRIDYPKYSHLGKKIPFSALPIKCQELILSDLSELN